jgi:hypothetical protein
MSAKAGCSKIPEWKLLRRLFSAAKAVDLTPFSSAFVSDAFALFCLRGDAIVTCAGGCLSSSSESAALPLPLGMRKTDDIYKFNSFYMQTLNEINNC